MACAITSLPVPVSPRRRTAQLTGATICTFSSTARNFGLDPIKTEIGIVVLLHVTNGRSYSVLCRLHAPSRNTYRDGRQPRTGLPLLRRSGVLGTEQA